LDGKAFAIEPVKRTAITKNLSDGSNEVTVAEIREKLNEPYIGIDGKLVTGYFKHYNEMTFGFNISAVVIESTGKYRVYFKEPMSSDEYTVSTIFDRPDDTSTDIQYFTYVTYKTVDSFLVVRYDIDDNLAASWFAATIFGGK
jgi:hypothetical protein